jgi:hypothetical protein
VPQVIVSFSMFMSFVLIVCKDMKFAYYHIWDTNVTTPYKIIVCI